MGNEETLETLDIVGNGDINLHITCDTRWMLMDVILGLKRKFISVGRVEMAGYQSSFRDGRWKVVRGSLDDVVVMKEESCTW